MKYEIIKGELKTLEADGFITYMPENITIRVEFKPLVDLYGSAKAEYFSKLLNILIDYLVKKGGYSVEGGLRGMEVGLGVTYYLKKSNRKKIKE